MDSRFPFGKPPPLPANLRPYGRTMAAHRKLAPSSVAPPSNALDDPSAASATGLPDAAGGSGGVQVDGPIELDSAVNLAPGPFALIAGEAAAMLSGNPKRRFLLVANMGTALAYIQFDNPVSGVLGIPLAGGATAWWDVAVPATPVSGYSPLGTSLYVAEG